MNNLTQYLASIPAGPINDTANVESLLAACWGQFTGDDGGMQGYKLRGRMEDVAWNPPRLTFVVERHGGTVHGSSRAELQHWTVDLETKTATLEKVGHRQLSAMQRRLDVEPLAEKVASLVASGQEHEWLEWRSASRVHVVIGRILPKGSAAKRTLEGRRKRLREALRERMEGTGWNWAGRGMFERNG